MPPTTPSAIDYDDTRRRALRRMQVIATGLLIAVALLYVLAVSLRAHHGAWDYVAAFAEAAMIGALADWFAVVALFRHPLGMRFIPHTAIIPKNKNRIADNLGQFVQGEFFATERVLKALRDLHPGRRLAILLSTPSQADRLASAALQMAGYALTALNEKAVQRWLQNVAGDLVRRLDLATLIGEVLDLLTRNGRHQELLDRLLARAAAFLNEPEVRENIEARAQEHIPLYFQTLKKYGAEKVVSRVLEVVASILTEIDKDPAHPLRATLDEGLAKMVERLRADDSLREQVEQWKAGLATDPAVARYLARVWADLREWMGKAAQDPSTVPHVSVVIQRVGRALAADDRMKAWIDDELATHVPGLLDSLRPRLARFIAEKVREWNESEIVEKLELNIGRDLQFIRINGTLVGGGVGLLLHAVTQWLTG
ncbi:DUF445 domain-containing protein [Pigmentiphaga aceris]|uniref:DUF445 domain-containing protein n=1 Tax=Pigmentiphaga aceris TaxID=1940612 RepID=A0A5C0ASU5_9BURK|nr:DUF445 domain-containing protein [Pigmentiphaga aceris]QEI04726.1 DUF445 domain-containing protein [Pigmentiphaga aceris]